MPRTLKEECLSRHQPTTIVQTRQAFEKFDYHYHHQRPHQGLACQNRPPVVAFPDLPPLRPLPDSVDPDAWLHTIASEAFPRRLDYQGRFQLGRHSYYVGSAQRGQQAVIWVDPLAQEFEVIIDGLDTYRLPIKGLHQQLLCFDDYCHLIKKEAVSEYRLAFAKKVRYLPLN